MQSLWSWLTWANFEHVLKNSSEDVVRTQKRRGNNGTDAVPTEYKPDVVFIEVVQTRYGRKSLHYVPTAFLLCPYYVSYVTTTTVSRFCQGKGRSTRSSGA